ncbi:MAG: protein kinase [candidate division Zixibacteria bacterium]|nr:protein kinase [candidate division Zixibacteria bacterium]
MIGKTISHYKVLEKLGEGGMGVVYKAEDTKLKRTIALKFLTPQVLGAEEEKARFVNEAQAAAALDHPNICTVYEIDEAEGHTFMSMAYLEGQSLKDKVKSGRLKLEEALDIVVQVAEGLREAHEKGIVHRDIKSANVMVTEKGQAKIMDFGLAKLAGGTQLTKTGTTMGTVAYMSPEQAKGEEVDHRTDIWSLGVVLYEMVTGQLPFQGEHEQAVIYSILNEEPEPVTGLRTGLSRELERTVNRALAKSPGERYQNAGDILVDLRKLRKELESETSKQKTSKIKPQPSIAVLPFTNLSADKEQEYFCDGMAEEIINALTHVESLRVVARTSAFAFKDRHEDIRGIGKKLNVETLLEGSVRKAGNRLRISAQLINVADGYHLWSDAYNRELEDVFAIQEEISMAIVDKLKVKLLGREKAKLVKRHTENLEAHSLYLKGRYFWNKRTEEDLKKSIEYFKQAIEKDPDYALAYAGMADSYNDLPSYSSFPPAETYPKAKEAAIKALEIDDTLAEAHSSLGVIRTESEWDWDGAEREFARALELNPASATTHHGYAYLLMLVARFDEAITEMKRAHELDPLSLAINRNLGQVFYFACQYDQAIEQLQKTIEMDPSFSYAHFLLGLAYGQKSMYKEALAELQKEKSLSGGWNPFAEAWFAIVYVAMGIRGKAQEVLDDLMERSKQEYVPSYMLALSYFALEKNDQGFLWLDKAYVKRDVWLRYLKIEPGFDSVRSDPRFTALLKKMGLEK